MKIHIQDKFIDSSIEISDIDDIEIIELILQKLKKIIIERNSITKDFHPVTKSVICFRCKKKDYSMPIDFDGSILCDSCDKKLRP